VNRSALNSYALHKEVFGSQDKKASRSSLRHLETDASKEGRPRTVIFTTDALSFSVCEDGNPLLSQLNEAGIGRDQSQLKRLGRRSDEMIRGVAV